MFFKCCHTRNLVFWQRVSDRRVLTVGVATFLMAIAVTVLGVSYAVADSLSSYCISKLGQRQKPKPAPPADMPARVTVPVNGEPFHVVASHDRLLLMRKEGAAPLAEVRAQQYEYGKISSLALGSDGWLWIDGDETDYMAPLDLNRKPLTLGRPVALPYLAVHSRDICQFCITLVRKFL